jgi:hypothetical protein
VISPGTPDVPSKKNSRLYQTGYAKQQDLYFLIRKARLFLHIVIARNEYATMNSGQFFWLKDRHRIQPSRFPSDI